MLLGATEPRYARTCIDLALTSGFPEPVPMRLHKVSGCDNGTCPAVYVSDRGTAVVQGTPVTTDTEGLTLGDGESAVELPPEIVLGAVVSLARSDLSRDVVERLHVELGEVLACS